MCIYDSKRMTCAYRLYFQLFLGTAYFTNYFLKDAAVKT